MSTALVVSVVLSNDEHEPSLVVEHDPTSTADSEVDIRSGRDNTLLVSCSLDELEEFAEHLISFVEHHRPEPESDE